MYKLLQKGVTGRLGRVISKLLADTKSRVRFQDQESAYFSITLGVGQGDPLSTILFDVFIDDLLVELDQQPIQHCIPIHTDTVQHVASLTYADDVNALSLTPAGLQSHINVISAWLFKWRSLPNVAKSKCMVFNPPKGEAPAAFYMRGTALECVSTYKYLGVHFQDDGSWAAHIHQVRLRMNRASLAGCSDSYLYPQPTFGLPLAVWGTLHDA